MVIMIQRSFILFGVTTDDFEMSMECDPRRTPVGALSEWLTCFMKTHQLRLCSNKSSLAHRKSRHLNTTSKSGCGWAGIWSFQNYMLWSNLVTYAGT